MNTHAYANRFEQNIEVYRRYVRHAGTTRVPLDHVAQLPDGTTIQLARWVTYVRTRYQAGLLAPERIAALEAIPGWSWGPRKTGPVGEIERNLEIRNLRNQGVSLGALAETYGLSRQRIHQIVSAA